MNATSDRTSTHCGKEHTFNFTIKQKHALLKLQETKCESQNIIVNKINVVINPLHQKKSKQ